MKVYSVAGVRERLAEALDEAERGTEVAIERRGVRYRLVAETPRPRARRAKPLLAVVDKTLLDGGWTWELGDDGQLSLAPHAPAPRRRPRSPRRRV